MKMMNKKLPIYYLGFWDVPETFYVEFNGVLLYFCRDFNEQIDDYESFYEIYKVDGVSIEEAVRPNPPLESCKMLILPDFNKNKPVGRVNVKDVIFDSTKRKFIKSNILETLGC